MLRLASIATLLTGLACSPAAAALADPAAVKPTKMRDPNEIVCEKEEVLGSRLATRRVCMTRAQWQERRIEDRMAIEKLQVSRGLKGE